MAVTQTLGGYTATSTRLSIPGWGLSYADVTVDGEHALTGATSLVLADLTVKCAVLSGGPAVGLSFFRVVVGAGGWGKQLKKRSYTNDGGVKLVTVLQDAANEAGETFDATTVDPSKVVGTYYVRQADLACRVLEQFAHGAWYVGEDGVTRLGARPASTLTAPAPVTSQVDLAQQRVTISSDTIAQVLPGLTYQGVTAVDVEHTATASGGLHSTLWGKIGAGQSRRLAAYRAIFDQLDPNRAYRGVYEYRVVTQSGERLNLQSVRVSTGLPDVKAVLPRPGVAGAKGQPALGSRVIVAFVNADPTNPVVIAYENAEAGGFLPLSVTLDASGSVHLGPSASSVDLAGGGQKVARNTDPVKVTIPANTFVVAVVGTSTGTLNPSPIDVTGTITDGSLKVTSG